MGEFVPGAGSPAPGPPGRPSLAALRAACDQRQAHLRDLVQMVRDHQDAHHDCITTGLLCPGEWAVEELLAATCGDRLALLGVALVELAALGYGLPTAADAHWPADPGGGA